MKTLSFLIRLYNYFYLLTFLYYNDFDVYMFSYVFFCVCVCVCMFLRLTFYLFVCVLIPDAVSPTYRRFMAANRLTDRVVCIELFVNLRLSIQILQELQFLQALRTFAFLNLQIVS